MKSSSTGPGSHPILFVMRCLALCPWPLDCLPPLLMLTGDIQYDNEANSDSESESDVSKHTRRMLIRNKLQKNSFGSNGETYTYH
jgi:hypothetical protein